jgi:AraC family transcriptional regulator, regulatory protein of adaptative response / methylated-DNA-[protein]-cysteine methyltransferase
MKFGPSKTKTTFATASQRWRALTQRDRRADGHFVYSVTTTGIYCRPGCPSRLAARANIAFHDTPAEAERAGFRPCKRCHPDSASPEQRHAERILRACRALEQSDIRPKLADLAAAAGLSPFHFQRLFKAAVGLSPREYAAAHRARAARTELRNGVSVTHAIYHSGYSSSSRFYEGAARRLGMTPSDFRRRGERQQIRFTIAQCSLGQVLIAATPRGICSIQFGENHAALESELRCEFSQASIHPADAPFRKWVKAVLNQIEEPARSIQLPLDVRGTAFQHRVWEALRKIPAGQTATYTEIAKQIGAPAAVRAVARACATNPVAVVVPCHRVVRKDKNLAGYRWGLERKRALLERES